MSLSGGTIDRHADSGAAAGARKPLAFMRPHGQVRRHVAPSTGRTTALRQALDARRLFVLLPFAMIAGLIASLQGSAMAHPAVLVGGVVAIGIAIPMLRATPAGLQFCALAAAFWAGYALLAIHGALFGTEMLGRPAYGTFQMRVDEVVSETESGKRVIVSGITAVGDTRAVPMRRARIVVPQDLDVASGDTIRGPVRFYEVPGPVVPHGFDTQFHAYFDGIGAYGNSTQPPTLAQRGDPASPFRFVETVRRAIADRISHGLGQPAAGIAIALITGDQSGVTDDAREIMANSGLAHVLSVSGLHLTIVAGGVFAVLRMLLASFAGLGGIVSAKRVAAVGGMLAALLYFGISGGNVAALRATVMILLVFGAVLVGRRALTMRNVAIAGIFVIATDPASVFRPSFQLSFAAVVALIGAWELAKDREGRDRGLAEQAFGYFVGIAVTSLVAGAATLPFSVYHFQQTSPLGVLGNLATLPLVGFVMMPAALIAALAMPLGLEGPFLAVMGWSIERMLDVARLIASWSGGLDASPLLTPTALVLALLALAWFAFWPGWRRLIGPVLLVPAVAALALDRPPDVLIADTTQAVAVRLDESLAVVAGKPSSFAVDVWRESYGEPIEAEKIACDSIACIASSTRGFSIAIIRDPAGFYEECDADLVIARIDAPSACHAGTIIDAEALQAGGVHWLAWDAGRGTFEARPAITDIGRPWRIVR
jgi:competence protein ComEC